MTTYFGEELFIRFTASAFRKLPSIYVFSYFPFGFEGRMWDLIVSVPDYCLSFYLVQAGEEAMIDILTTICNKIWKTGELPTTWTQSLVITLPKKDNLLLCQNYRTISLISHPSKVMLKVILNRLQPQVEEIFAEEQKDKMSRFQSRKEHHRTNIQSQDPRREIPAASADSLPCLHRLQEDL